MAKAKKKKQKSKGKRPKAGKGSSFERRICKELGLWWTDGERDDVFWRTSNSGGRATVRRKTAKGTFGQEGDVQATDPIGQPLMDLCTIEIKCGYSHTSFMDIIDKPARCVVQQWEKWLEQAERESGGTGRWMLITKANSRQVMVFLSRRLGTCLRQVGVHLRQAEPSLSFIPLVKNKKLRRLIISTTLSEFTRLVKRTHIEEAALNLEIFGND